MKGVTHTSRAKGSGVRRAKPLFSESPSIKKGIANHGYSPTRTINSFAKADDNIGERVTTVPDQAEHLKFNMEKCIVDKKSIAPQSESSPATKSLKVKKVAPIKIASRDEKMDLDISSNGPEEEHAHIFTMPHSPIVKAAYFSQRK